MVGRIAPPNAVYAAGSVPPPLTQAQQEELQEYINNLWALTYAANGGSSSPPPSPNQLAMIAQSITALVNFVNSLGKVSLDTGTQKLMADLNAGRSSSIAATAAALEANPTSIQDFANFENEYNQGGVGVSNDMHNWYSGTSNGYYQDNGDIPYVPNSTPANPSSAGAITNFSQFQDDVQQFQKDLANYLGNPSNPNFMKALVADITALNADLGSAVPPNLDPYETAIYQMLNTPMPGGSSLLSLAQSNNTAGITDFLGNNNPGSGNGQIYANILNLMVSENCY